MPLVCLPPTPDHPSDPADAPGSGDDNATGAVSAGEGVVQQVDGGGQPSGGAPDPAPPGSPGCIPTQLLRRAQVLLASPKSRGRSRLLGLVIIPRTPVLQAAEDALSSALIALVVGTRPSVTTAMVRAHLAKSFGIVNDLVTVRHHWPEDFIVRFSRLEDLELVLGMPPAVAAPFSLRWRR